MKICSKCSLEKEDIDFPKTKNKCKVCMAIYNKFYYENNKEHLLQLNRDSYKINVEKICEQKKEYNKKNNKARKEWYENNKNRTKQSKKDYYNANKNHIKENRNKYSKVKYANDPIFRIRQLISSSIRKQLQRNTSYKSRKSCLDYLRYTIQELKEHIEKQFEPWMNWSNQGAYNAKTWKDDDQATHTWQLDHIIPHSAFQYASIEDQSFKKCWALSNLRPYSAKQNIIDGNRRNVKVDKK